MNVNYVKYKILKTQLSCFPFFTCPHFQCKLIIVTLDRMCLSCTTPSWFLELWNHVSIELEEQNLFWMVVVQKEISCPGTRASPWDGPPSEGAWLGAGKKSGRK